MLSWIETIYRGEGDNASLALELAPPALLAVSVQDGGRVSSAEVRSDSQTTHSLNL